MSESNHFRVVLRVEELDENGDCIDVGSEDVLADFPNDDNGINVGQQSDDFYNQILRTLRRI